MGLLDDAIREHLDLKRRRGADPTEIERAEREALGPVRRGPEVTGGEPASLETDPGLEPVYPESAASGSDRAEIHPADDEEPWERFEEDPELRALEEDEALPPYEPVHAPDGDPLMDDERFASEAHRAVPPHAADAPMPEPDSPPTPHPADSPPAPPREEPLGHVDRETEEYEREPEEGAEDDVLESTPEFLQDAPEHDRLWFEQRPPRDFDFDG
jgi:hypothetical protein